MKKSLRPPPFIISPNKKAWPEFTEPIVSVRLPVSKQCTAKQMYSAGETSVEYRLVRMQTCIFSDALRRSIFGRAVSWVVVNGFPGLEQDWNRFECRWMAERSNASRSVATPSENTGAAYHPTLDILHNVRLQGGTALCILIRRTVPLRHEKGYEVYPRPGLFSLKFPWTEKNQLPAKLVVGPDCAIRC